MQERREKLRYGDKIGRLAEPSSLSFAEFFSESVRGALYDMLDNIEFEDITIDAIQAGSVIVDYTIQVVPQWSSRVRAVQTSFAAYSALLM